MADLQGAKIEGQLGTRWPAKRSTHRFIEEHLVKVVYRAQLLGQANELGRRDMPE
jgi:hypothetical protein